MKELILIRESDGQIYTRNKNGTFSNEKSEMHKPWEWSYKHLMDTQYFRVAYR